MATTGEDDGATAAHVNMMTDTIIINLPEHGLRSIMRALLAANPSLTGAFERETRRYTLQSTNVAFLNHADVERAQKIVRCMLGSNMCIESLPRLCGLVSRAASVEWPSQTAYAEFTASLDGDIVQAMTAVQKLLFDRTGSRALSDGERSAVEQLFHALRDAQNASNAAGQDCSFGRGIFTCSSLLRLEVNVISQSPATVSSHEYKSPTPCKETFQLNGKQLPRIFSGLWQLSSPAWGTAPSAKIVDGFSSYIQRGFTAFDMADHYGDAEIIYGRFLSSCPFRDEMFTATKYCIFHKMTITREAVKANIHERCQRLQQPRIDLLQFHWQFYDDPQYLDALRFLAEDERVRTVGLCNFDTEHLMRVIESEIPVHSNQVQFSLIDSRPTVAMGEVCERHNVALLTYGTLCGGFLADEWLNQPEPEMYDNSSTPSKRKYHEMIRNWGNWELFQELLKTLKRISSKHGVRIANVAVRWVLDFPYVGAVIIGARMGVTEHTAENLASLGWSLDSEDQSAIEAILQRSKRAKMFDMLGDCGGEYRK